MPMGSALADIFISYARADRDRIEKLAAALEAHGYSVWWDRHIEAGAEFSADIERELNTAKAVIVCWSEEGAKSRWVKDEATIAADAGKLVAVALDGELPPIGFRQYHAASLADWPKRADSPAFQDLLRALAARTQDSSAPAAAQPASLQKSASWLARPQALIGLALFGAALIAALVVLWSGGDEMPAASGQSMAQAPASDATAIAPAQASIAVLAFSDLSPARDQEYFADGIAEEILNVLARVSGLKVASRTSAFALKGEDLDVRAISERLGAAYVLEGSVRKAGDQVRVTAQLIEAATDNHLLSETYTRQLTAENVFEIQDEIASAIVETLGQRNVLRGVDRENVRIAAGTDDIRAYDLFLEGHDIFVRRDFPQFQRMIEAFEQAVTIDPKFARAHASLAGAYGIQNGWGVFDRDYEGLAAQSAREALALDPDLAFAYAVLADSTCEGGECLAETDLLNKAASLDPLDPTIFNWRGQHLMALGFFDRARTDFERCLELDPAYVNCRSHLAVVQALLGDFDSALTHIGIVRAQPVAALHLMHVAAELDAAGRESEAVALMSDSAATLFTADASPGEQERFGRIFVSLNNPGVDTEQVWNDEVISALPPAADTDDAAPPDIYYFFRRFDQIPNLSGGAFYWLTFHPEFLQSDKRYGIFSSLGLPEYWRARGYPPQCRVIDPRPDGRDYECD